MSTITLLCIALTGVIMLLLLVIKAKVQPFVALLLVVNAKIIGRFSPFLMSAIGH